ncbi:hypothetical protein WJX74_008289 [Apatococcus lobatus]|uniref:Uncharacterized protein n=1 Tax=Apatococcus lobatus TaxID=904363 RepID=A0AAW1Q341_9CHLO
MATLDPAAPAQEASETPVVDAVAAEQPAAAPAAAQAAAGDAAPAEAREPEAAVEGREADGSKPKDPPVHIGFKQFDSAEAALKYFYDLVKCLRREQDINEYEHKMVYDLLEKGHPSAAQKIGCGVAAFQIMKHHDIDSECFFVIRTDGSREDFSIRKSVASLFPIWGQQNPMKAAARATDRGRGLGRGPGRGRGEGRGGGGRGRGGGRGFRARGRGGRRGRGR